ncbi:radical SAM protein [Nocardioides mangrovi]|uniref:Radical SAM protein n=1 Tax=Nocardioides mangrovi TaxID=2874580 RepID=A0ABS7U7E6_9ACTN|nr:radical SAM protein [Nocardioides mangrovi]MBZ5736894.1 radical SAM protein [Nocardioides mangrovi]
MTGHPITQRGDIRMGYRCNARCGFCYYQEKLDTPVNEEPTTDELVERLRLLRRHGATEVEFTGGEPTIRKDLPDLIALARSMGFVNVSVISNGIQMSRLPYTASLVEAGANDFLLSVHGHTAQLHDSHTKIRGSFDRIMQAMANVKECGVRCRTSTTVTAQNHQDLTAICGHLIEHGADGMHLAVFSPVAQALAVDQGMAISYPDAATAIKQAIDAHLHHLPPVSVKYIPFCFMVGYEQYVMNLYQQSFDSDDWNYYWSNKLRHADRPVKRFLFDVAALGGAAFLRNRRFAAGYGVAGLKTLGFTRGVEMLRKERPAACRECRYDAVCDHLWKGYVATYGTEDIVPVSGARVVDPAWSYVIPRSRTTGTPLPDGEPPPHRRLLPVVTP